MHGQSFRGFDCPLLIATNYVILTWIPMTYVRENRRDYRVQHNLHRTLKRLYSASGFLVRLHVHIAHCNQSRDYSIRCRIEREFQCHQAHEGPVTPSLLHCDCL